MARYPDRMRLLGAVLRLTRLVTTDQVGQWWIKDPIDAAMTRYEDAHLDGPEPWWWRYRSGLDCPFCVGFWVGLGALAVEVSPLGRSRVWRGLTGALALNYLVGHVAARLDGED